MELKDFDVRFYIIENKTPQLLLYPSYGATCLVKLYLISESQFGQFRSSNYCTVMNLGTLEKYEIFCVTNSEVITQMPAMLSPCSEITKSWYEYLKISFPELSQNYLVFYINSKIETLKRRNSKTDIKVLTGTVKLDYF